MDVGTSENGKGGGWASMSVVELETWMWRGSVCGGGRETLNVEVASYMFPRGRAIGYIAAATRP